MRKLAVVAVAALLGWRWAWCGTPALVFVFGQDEKGRRVGGKHDTTLLIIRNRRKLRPLFVTGKALEGTLKVKLREGIEPQMAGILEAAAATGSFTVNFIHYGSSRFDLQRRAATEWLKLDPWPEITFTATALTGWDPVPERKKKGGEAFKVTVRGRLAGAGRAAEVEIPATVTIRPGKSGKKRQPPMLVLESNFKLKGSAIGLSGEDATQLDLFLYCQGLGAVEGGR